MYDHRDTFISAHRDATLDLDALLHPADAFAQPMDVVCDRDLTLDEKRAILASWASDACAVEAAPELRTTPFGKTVRWDEIMDALRLLDEQASDMPRPAPRRQYRWRNRSRSSGGETGAGAQPG